MTLSVTHTFVSAIADDPTASAAGEVLPSHWNASHTLTGQVDLTAQVTGILPAANGGTGTSTGYLPRTVNAQTGASYTILASDIGKLVTTSNAGAIATTLPQATGSFGAGSILWIENKGAGTNTITPTTSTIDGSATLALTTNQGVTLVSDGTNWTTIRGIGGAGGGTPGGSATQLQYNNSGAFGGIAGSAVSANGGVTLGGATVTASDPVLALSQTWNNAAVVFTALKSNITNTASAAGSLLLDLQLAGSSKFKVAKDGPIVTIASPGYSAGDALSILDPGGTVAFSFSSSNANILHVIDSTSNGAGITVDGSFLSSSANGRADYKFCLTGNATDIALTRVGSTGTNGILSLWGSSNNPTKASGLFVYNTTDNLTSGAPTNYERAIFDWTTSANTLTIGTQAGGTGTVRDYAIVRGGDVHLTSVTSTVAGLPAASAGLKGARRYVTDANATTFLTTVAGGGSSVVPVFCDGTAWKIG